MSWLYRIAEHSIEEVLGVATRLLTTDCYSGAFGESQNNPACCGEVDRGPIPPGNWFILALVNDPETGEDTLVLEPADAATRAAIIALKRAPDSFRIHGERIAPPPGCASKGCIVAPHAVRMEIWDSGDRELQVAA